VWRKIKKMKKKGDTDRLKNPSMIIRLIMVVAICIVPLTVLVDAQTTGIIKGKVLDAYTGEPIQNALIEFYPSGADPSTSVPVITTRAEDGNFTVTLEKGLYDVYASRVGYHKQSKKEIGLIPQQTVNLIFELELTNEIIKEAVSNGIEYLKDNQNSDGSFGDGEIGNKIETTSWAIIAYTKIIGNAVDWLKNAQNFDGSWGGSGDDRVKLTGLSVSALKKADIISEDETIDNAVKWLKDQQNAEGSFGSATDTGIAILALLSVGEKPSEQHIKNAITWLTGAQSQDGGWGSLEATFFAVKALKTSGSGSDLKFKNAIGWVENTAEEKGW
jgi:prenyltransferase beta subunit